VFAGCCTDQRLPTVGTVAIRVDEDVKFQVHPVRRRLSQAAVSFGSRSMPDSGHNDHGTDFYIRRANEFACAMYAFSRISRRITERLIGSMSSSLRRHTTQACAPRHTLNSAYGVASLARMPGLCVVARCGGVVRRRTEPPGEARSCCNEKKRDL